MTILRKDDKTRRIVNKNQQTKRFSNYSYMPYLKNMWSNRSLLTHPNIKTSLKQHNRFETGCARQKIDRIHSLNPLFTEFPYSCDSLYVETTKLSIITRISEHECSCRLDQLGKYAVAEHVRRPYKPHHQILWHSCFIDHIKQLPTTICSHRNQQTSKHLQQEMYMTLKSMVSRS